MQRMRSDSPADRDGRSGAPRTERVAKTTETNDFEYVKARQSGRMRTSASSAPAGGMHTFVTDWTRSLPRYCSSRRPAQIGARAIPAATPAARPVAGGLAGVPCARSPSVSRSRPVAGREAVARPFPTLSPALPDPDLGCSLGSRPSAASLPRGRRWQRPQQTGWPAVTCQGTPLSVGPPAPRAAPAVPSSHLAARGGPPAGTAGPADGLPAGLAHGALHRPAVEGCSRAGVWALRRVRRGQRG
mmetsp:Transcript_82149/g.256541  ORF Transcript_82149/g.256541 Transcript_82149/m.256541 type:complete len:244 (+) Transcript_82149:725-1456(+)